MRKKKSKSNVTSNVYEWDVLNSDPANIAEFADTPEGKYSPFFRAPDCQHISIGGSLGDCEHEGNGLPEWRNERQLFSEIDLNFTVRVTCDPEGTTYLEIHQVGSPSFHSFPFTGIDYKNLFRVAPAFENNLSQFLIYYGISALFESFYWERASKENREESYDAIIKSAENYFKSILKPKRKREIARREIKPGLTITTYESIETGREPKMEAELEHEKSKFISNVFDALKEIESYNGPNTILEAAHIMFPTSKNPKKTLDNKIRAYHLSWKNLKQDYENLKNCN